MSFEDLFASVGRSLDLGVEALRNRLTRRSRRVTPLGESIAGSLSRARSRAREAAGELSLRYNINPRRIDPARRQLLALAALALFGGLTLAILLWRLTGAAAPPPIDEERWAIILDAAAAREARAAEAPVTVEPMRALRRP